MIVVYMLKTSFSQVDPLTYEKWPKLCNWLNDRISKRQVSGAAKHRGSIFASHPAAPDSNPGSAEIFFPILLRLWTALRLNPSSAKEWVSQMQLVVISRAK